MLNVRDPLEIEEFSLYCIVEGGEIFKKIFPFSPNFPVFPKISPFFQMKNPIFRNFRSIHDAIEQG